MTLTQVGMGLLGLLVGIFILDVIAIACTHIETLLV